MNFIEIFKDLSEKIRNKSNRLRNGPKYEVVLSRRDANPRIRR